MSVSKDSLYIWIVGPPGSGKTTISKKLGVELDFLCIHLDELYWDKNWVKKSSGSVESQITEHAKYPRIIIDGFYSESALFVSKEADYVFIIRINYFRMMARILKRSIRRIVRDEKVCGENHENWRFLLSGEGLFKYAHQQYAYFQGVGSKDFPKQKVVIVKKYEEIIDYLYLKEVRYEFGYKTK